MRYAPAGPAPAFCRRLFLLGTISRHGDPLPTRRVDPSRRRLRAPGGPQNSPVNRPQRRIPALSEARFLPVRCPASCAVYAAACATGTAETRRIRFGLRAGIRRCGKFCSPAHAAKLNPEAAPPSPHGLGRGGGAHQEPAAHAGPDRGRRREAPPRHARNRPRLLREKRGGAQLGARQKRGRRQPRLPLHRRCGGVDSLRPGRRGAAAL